MQAKSIPQDGSNHTGLDFRSILGMKTSHSGLNFYQILTSVILEDTFQKNTYQYQLSLYIVCKYCELISPKPQLTTESNKIPDAL